MIHNNQTCCTFPVNAFCTGETLENGMWQRKGVGKCQGTCFKVPHFKWWIRWSKSVLAFSSGGQIPTPCVMHWALTFQNTKKESFLLKAFCSLLTQKETQNVGTCLSKMWSSSQHAFSSAFIVKSNIQCAKNQILQIMAIDCGNNRSNLEKGENVIQPELPFVCTAQLQWCVLAFAVMTANLCLQLWLRFNIANSFLWRKLQSVNLCHGLNQLAQFCESVCASIGWSCICLRPLTNDNNARRPQTFLCICLPQFHRNQLFHIEVVWKGRCLQSHTMHFAFIFQILFDSSNKPWFCAISTDFAIQVHSIRLKKLGMHMPFGHLELLLKFCAWAKQKLKEAWHTTQITAHHCLWPMEQGVCHQSRQCRKWITFAKCCLAIWRSVSDIFWHLENFLILLQTCSQTAFLGGQRHCRFVENACMQHEWTKMKMQNVFNWLEFVGSLVSPLWTNISQWLFVCTIGFWMQCENTHKELRNNQTHVDIEIATGILSWFHQKWVPWMGENGETGGRKVHRWNFLVGAINGF